MSFTHAHNFGHNTHKAISPNSIIWADSRINNNFYKKTALFLPVQFEDIYGESQYYFMQLDFGSSKTIFYPNLIKKNPAIAHIVKDIKHDAPPFSPLNQKVSLIIGESSKIELISALIFKLNEIDATSNHEIGIDKNLIIGSLGNDILDNNDIILDFSKNKFIILANLNIDYSVNKIQNIFKEKNRHINLNIEVNGVSIDTIYDTGSSMFGLLIGYNLWQKFKQNNSKYAVETLVIDSWNRKINIEKIKKRTKIKLEANCFFVNEVYGICDSIMSEEFDTINIGGIIGNKLFGNRKIFLSKRKNLMWFS